MNGIATVSAVFLLFCAQQADAYSFATGGRQAVQVNMRQRSGLAVGNVYCVRARYYSADLKRFATVDPIGIQGGLNLYVYGSDNPLAFLDPLGLCDGPSWGQGSANNSRYGPILKSSDDPDYDPDALAANNMFSGLGAANLSNGDMARDLTITAITTVAGEAVLGPAVSGVRKFLKFGNAKNSTALVKYDANFALQQGGNPATVVPGPYTVVRGGQAPVPPAGTTFSGSMGSTVSEAAAGVPHGTIRVTTANAIRQQGGTVVLAP